MIRGLHAMFYSSAAPETRAFFRDKLGFPTADVGDGWLISDIPEADLGCHPLDFPNPPESGTADISFYCDDLEATVQELRGRGVEFADEIKDCGFGFVTHMKVPGEFQVMLYQPKYKK